MEPFKSSQTLSRALPSVLKHSQNLVSSKESQNSESDHSLALLFPILGDFLKGFLFLHEIGFAVEGFNRRFPKFRHFFRAWVCPTFPCPPLPRVERENHSVFNSWQLGTALVRAQWFWEALNPLLRLFLR